MIEEPKLSADQVRMLPHLREVFFVTVLSAVVIGFIFGILFIGVLRR
jgi:hypothetical protein